MLSNSLLLGAGALASAVLMCVGIGKASLPKHNYDETITINGDRYEMTFYDDFDGDSLDLSKWSVCPEYDRQDVGGKWDKTKAYVDGKGNLVVMADIDKNGTPVSGAIRTKGKFQQCRGYYEIRCKLQSQKGFWGAFWIMSGNMTTAGKGASDGVEIDIFESFSPSEGGVNHAIHWDGYGEQHKSRGIGVYDTSLYDGEYHVFSLLWDENGYYFYIDGKETYRIDGEIDGYSCSSEKSGYLKVTTEFGSWAGSYEKEKLPDGIVVDYVKVYQKQDSK